MSRHGHKHINCLNCGTELNGRYCSKCGQDSEEHLDSVWHLVKHFFEDITHYDGKLWKTAKPLLIRPGFLTQEYMKGKRASYLHPVRMFIFLNFVFFFLLLSLPSAKTDHNAYTFGQVASNKAIQDTLKEVYNEAQKDVKVGKVATVHLSDSTLETKEQYDSVQALLPAAKRDGWIKRMINEKGLDMIQASKKDPDYVSEKIDEIFFHNAAKLTFLFLIATACLLSLLYYRKHIWMIDHALFSIHLSCTFLLLSVFMLLLSYMPYGGYADFIIFLYGNYYFYRALRVIYQQSSGKTMLKFFILNFLLAIIMALSLILNALFAMLSISHPSL